MTSRDDDIDEIIRSAQNEPTVNSGQRHIIVMLSLICKAVRDLQKTTT